MLLRLIPLAALLIFPVVRAGPVLRIKGDRILVDARETKLLGLRCSNALLNEHSTDSLISQFPNYRSAGLNTVSAFFMGSRFGDVKGYRPDATLDPACSRRMKRILDAANRHDMVVIVGCLYWSTSKAKEDLGHWNQADANRAIANTANWLRQTGFKNVILDPDNEGMACREMHWSVKPMIAAAHDAYPGLIVANNTRQDPPNEDLNMHFGKPEKGKPWLDSEATPGNAPGGYWGKFSKETHQNSKGSFYNYSRIGRYTAEMKADQLRQTREGITRFNGHILASTWLQCGNAEAVEGPFAAFGGRSNLGDRGDDAWDSDIDQLHPEAGILWWIESLAEFRQEPARSIP